MKNRYDYIVIGAGSAGCPLANRLSADPNRSVLLIESGPEHGGMFMQMPRGVGSGRYGRISASPPVHASLVTDRRAVRHGKLAQRHGSRYRPFEIRRLKVVSDNYGTYRDRGMLPIALGDFTIRIKPEDI